MHCSLHSLYYGSIDTGMPCMAHSAEWFCTAKAKDWAGRPPCTDVNMLLCSVLAFNTIFPPVVFLCAAPGHIPYLLRHDYHIQALEWANKYGGICRFSLGGQHIILVSGARVCRQSQLQAAASCSALWGAAEAVNFSVGMLCCI